MLALDSDATRGWLDGIAYGPGVHVSQLQLLARLPHGYELRQYPDLSHSLAAMYPQPNWHRACKIVILSRFVALSVPLIQKSITISGALTHGRLVVNPSPRRHSAIARMNMNSSFSRAIGFGGYSEGASDDVNKCTTEVLLDSVALAVSLTRRVSLFQASGAHFTSSRARPRPT